MHLLFLQSILVEGVLILFFMSALFEISLILKRNDVADIGWGLGFIFASLGAYIWVSSRSTLDTYMLTLIVLWGLRIFVHIFKRNRYKEEDARYKAWRVAWGKSFYLRSFFQIYILQGFLMFLILMPVTVVFSTEQTGYNMPYILIGSIVWLVGFFFESFGDWQLSRFLSNTKNKGKLMTSGLWSMTRHPNYFGEVSQWWGVWAISLAVIPWYAGIVGPLVITYLILGVSGIPMTERGMLDRPDFQEYKKRTSAFFPWFPKK